MKRNQDPAFLFYSDNFLSGTMFFTNEQVGIFTRLLCAQHLTGHLTEENMMKVSSRYDKEVWEKFERDSDGKFFNQWLEEEIKRRKLYSESRANNRLGKGNSTKKEGEKTSYDAHMETGTETRTEDITETGAENTTGTETEIGNTWKDVFQNWIDYRKKMDKPLPEPSLDGALQRLRKLSGDNKAKAREIIQYSIDNGYQGLFDPGTDKQQPKNIIEKWTS
jgi:uncharacterized protein YdaU (DUF1376 family)